MAGEIGRIRAQLEVVPLAAASKGAQPYIYSDIRELSTNKVLSSGEAGNWSVTFAVPHGRGILSEFMDNDVAILSARRGDGAFGLNDRLLIGQVDSIARNETPDQVEWTIAGKDLTNQFITQTIYVQQIKFDQDGKVVPIGVSQFALANVIYELFGCVDSWVKVEDTLSVPPTEIEGINIQCFLEKLVTNGIYIDPDLLFEEAYIQAQHLIPDMARNISFQSPAAVLDQLANPPWIRWFVTEMGGFVFKPWNWRDATPQQIIYNSEHMNHHQRTASYNVISACTVTPELAPASEGMLGVAADEALAARYGMRHLAIGGAPYLYSGRMSRDRARDEIQMHYLQRRDASVTLHGSSRWRVDQYAYWEKLGGYWFIDGVQHRLGFRDGTSWTTTLGLTHGRARPDSYLDWAAGQAAIGVELGRTTEPLALAVPRPIFALPTVEADEDAT